MKKEKTKAAAAKSKPGAKPTQAPAHAIFEAGSELVDALPSVAESALKSMCLEKPAIISFESETLGKLFGSDVKVAMGQLKKLFTQPGATHSRAEVGLDLSVVKHVAKLLDGMLPDGMSFYTGMADSLPQDVESLAIQTLRKNMLSTSYAILANNATFATEKFFLPCLLFASERLRHVVLAPCDNVLDFISSPGAPQSKLADPQAKQGVNQFLKFCNADKLKAFVEASGSKCLGGVVHAAEVLYVPAGWAFAEQTKDMSLGLKTPVFARAACARDFFSKIQTLPGDVPSDQGLLAKAYYHACSVNPPTAAAANQNKKDGPEGDAKDALTEL